MRSRPLSALAGISLIVVALLAALSSPAGADTATQAASEWLDSRQQTDGGIYEPAAFGTAAFETPDAILAVAENAQTTSTWSTAEALAAVEAIDDASGLTPLDPMDDLAEDLSASDGGTVGDDGGPAAKLLVLVALPLGLPTTAFDPAGDGDPVDLEAILAADVPGPALFNSLVYATLANAALDEPTGTLVQHIRDAQQANGGWGFAGDPDATDVDIDTTGYALAALVAAGVPAGDATVEAGVRLLASTHQTSGAWQFFGDDETNSTAVGMIGLEATGWDRASRCWRDANAPSTATASYTNPETWLRSRQLVSPSPDAGGFQVNFTGPNGELGTLGTSQAVQALLGGWLPGTSGTAALQPAETFTDVGPCDPYTQGVAWMQDYGLTTGFSGGTFRPGNAMPRQAMAAQLFRFVDPDAWVPPTEPTFTDVPTTHPFFSEIEWLVAEGITTGFGDGTFKPNRTVNRGQAATFLYRVAGEPPLAEDAPTFPDVPASSVFAAGVSWMADFRLTAGFPGGTFKPANTLNRAQLAQFLYRLASTQPAWDDIDLPPSVQF